MDAAGDFVIVWSDANLGIRAQRFDANGNPEGREFQVSTDTCSQKKSPHIAMDYKGDSVITWSSYGQDGNGWGIFAQRYDASGQSQGPEFQVNTYSLGDQDNSSVAMSASGSFVVVWQSYNQDGQGWGIFAQMFDPCGNPLGLETPVNTTTAGNQMNPSVAMDASGNFMVTWTSDDGGASGNKTPIVVNLDPMSVGGTSSPGGGSGGLLTIQSQVVAAKDNPGGLNIYAQQFDEEGHALGIEFRVNTNTGGNQQNSAIAMDRMGHIVVDWISSGLLGLYAVRAQEFVDAADDFNAPDSIERSSTPHAPPVTPHDLIGEMFREERESNLSSQWNDYQTQLEIIVDAPSREIYWNDQNLDHFFAEDSSIEPLHHHRYSSWDQNDQEASENHAAIGLALKDPLAS